MPSRVGPTKIIPPDHFIRGHGRSPSLEDHLPASQVDRDGNPQPKFCPPGRTGWPPMSSQDTWLNHYKAG